MKTITHLTCAIWCLSAATVAAADVVDTASERAVAFAPGQPAIAFKREDWLIRSESRTKEGSLVYDLESEQRGRDLLFGIWLSKDPKCGSAERCLEEQIGLGQVPKDATDVERFTVGPFTAVKYHRENPNGLAGKVSDVFAVARVGDCLFRVKLMKSNSWAGRVLAYPKDDYEPLTSYPDMAPMLELLESLQIRQAAP